MCGKVTILFACLTLVNGLNNGLGRTPAMGWNSWYNFQCNYNEQMIKETVDIIISTGLASLGYQYINLDDCWQISRDASGRIQPDPKAFPNGLQPLIDYVHSRGLKFGLYSDAGYKTCAGRPGSLGYEKIDAAAYADWKVDFLKYDNCNDDGTKPEVRYPVMRDALNQTGRPIFYSLCEWGVDSPALWAMDVGNSWRTAGDLEDKWEAMISTIDINNEFAGQAGPGGWNDPDMLRIGNGGMSDVEYVTYFSLWSLSKSPLIIGCDVRQMSSATLKTYSNREVIAVNQDPLGIQGKRIVVLPSRFSNSSSRVLITSCSTLRSMREQQKWIDHSDDQTIRSTVDGRCLTVSPIDSTTSISAPCLSDLDDHQRWIVDKQNRTIVSQLTKKCLSRSKKETTSVELVLCDLGEDQRWMWNEENLLLVDSECLTVEQALEIWSVSLSDGCQSVLLLNRNSSTSESITVHWTDLDWPPNLPALVRDLWTGEDLGRFISNFTSPPLDQHAVQMLKITLAV